MPGAARVNRAGVWHREQQRDAWEIERIERWMPKSDRVATGRNRTELKASAIVRRDRAVDLGNRHGGSGEPPVSDQRVEYRAPHDRLSVSSVQRDACRCQEYREPANRAHDQLLRLICTSRSRANRRPVGVAASPPPAVSR